MSFIPFVSGNTTKQNNRTLVLKEIRNHKSITKMDLINTFDLTPTAIGNIIDELIKADIIHKVGYGKSKGGRPPVLYAIKWDKVYVIAIAIGVQNISASLVNLKGEIRGEIIFDNSNSPLIERVYALIGILFEKAGEEGRKILGIGISAPGPVDSSSGVILTPPNLEGANNLDITKLLEDRYKLSTILEVDANASALAEQWFGAVDLNKDILYIYNDQGLGGSLIINTRMYKGFGNGAGEIGHMTVDLDGPQCSCGNYGCLEILSSGIAIKKEVKAQIRRGFPTSLQNLYKDGVDKLELNNIVEYARNGDQLAKQTLDKAARYLGIGLSNAINLFSPDKVIFGGDVITLYPESIEIAEEVAKERSFSPLAKKIEFEKSKFNEHSNLIGAAATIQQKLFDNPEGIII